MRGHEAVSQIADTQKTSTELQMKVAQQDSEIHKKDEALRSAGTVSEAKELESLRARIVTLQAQLNGYQNAVERDAKQTAKNKEVLTLLASSGLRLLTLHAEDLATNPAGYVLLKDGSRLMLTMSNLPRPGNGKEYQAWLLRKNDPALVKLGRFSPDEGGRALLSFADEELVTDVASVLVTEEAAAEDTKIPSATRILNTAPEE